MAIEDHFEYLHFTEDANGQRCVIAPSDPLPRGVGAAVLVDSTPCWAAIGPNPHDGRIAFIETGGRSSPLMVHQNRVANGIRWWLDD